MSLDVKDLGIGRLKVQLQRLGKLKIMLGVQGEEAAAIHPEAQVPTGLLALWLHYGTNRMPARPWVDHAIAQIRGQAGVAVKKAIADLIDGREADEVEAMRPVGRMGVTAMVEAIDTSKSWATPLARSTVIGKGHDQPLLDTGTLRDSNSYTIRENDQVLAKGTVADG